MRRLAGAIASSLSLDTSCIAPLDGSLAPAYFISDPALVPTLEPLLARRASGMASRQAAALTRQGQTVVAADARSLPLVSSRWRRAAPKGSWVLIAPVVDDGKVQALLGLAGRHERCRLPDERLVEALQEAVAGALRGTRVQERSRHCGQTMTALAGLGSVLVASGSLEDRLRRLTDRFASRTGLDAVRIEVMDPQRGIHGVQTTRSEASRRLQTRSFSSLDPERISALQDRWRSDRGLRAADGTDSSRQSAPNINDLFLAGARIRSVVDIPLVCQGQFLGILWVGRAAQDAFCEEDLRALSGIAAQLAVSIKNAFLLDEVQRSYSELREAHLETVMLLASAAEARDPYTNNHLPRIRAYSEATARSLGLPERQVEEIGHSSMLHDLGKLTVPDAVLAKPGPLSKEERQLILGHPAAGERLLGNSPFLETARRVARCHHERWDGRGYPDGLRGEDIPLEARIVSLADVFDALTSERPYKEAWPLDRALAEIRHVRGSQLDPRVVDAFLEPAVVHLLERTVGRRADGARAA